MTSRSRSMVACGDLVLLVERVQPARVDAPLVGGRCRCHPPILAGAGKACSLRGAAGPASWPVWACHCRVLRPRVAGVAAAQLAADGGIAGDPEPGEVRGGGDDPLGGGEQLQPQRTAGDQRCPRPAEHLLHPHRQRRDVRIGVVDPDPGAGGDLDPLGHDVVEPAGDCHGTSARSAATTSSRVRSARLRAPDTSIAASSAVVVDGRPRVAEAGVAAASRARSCSAAGVQRSSPRPSRRRPSATAAATSAGSGSGSGRSASTIAPSRSTRRWTRRRRARSPRRARCAARRRPPARSPRRSRRRPHPRVPAARGTGRRRRSPATGRRSAPSRARARRRCRRP